MTKNKVKCPSCNKTVIVKYSTKGHGFYYCPDCEFEIFENELEEVK